MLCLSSWMTNRRHGCAFGETTSASASVWLWGVCCCIRAQRLLLVYEIQQEKCDVVWAPIACVRGHCRPVAALHQTLSELEVHSLLQLHWKTRKASPRVQKNRSICPITAVLTWCVSSGGGGPSYGWEPICRLAFCLLWLLFLSVCSTLQTWRHRGLTVGARETGKEDSSDAFADTGRSCS